MWKNVAYYLKNRHINYTNICKYDCMFCSFYRKEGQEGAWLWSVDQVLEHVAPYKGKGLKEFHIVGGVHPTLPFSYYTDMLRALKREHPDIAIKAFTAIEIAYLSEISGLPLKQVLTELKAAGLDMVPGGGAEVFADRVRRLIAPGKEHPDFWFHTHRTAHGLGIPTHCTLLYGHVETYEERVDHLLRLRELQDETGGFLAFIPLAFHPENTVFERRGWRHTAGSDDLKMIAVSRLLLDNVENVKAYWIMMGMPLAAVALHFGANDVQGTVVREEIFHAAGATTETEQKVEELVRFVQEAGRIPVQRDTLYREVRRWPA
jgi:aminodeoxyfutalosine synthase